VESRKAWRNRAPSAGEGVIALLEALREGLGAQGVALFDDDRAEPGQPSPPNFLDAFEDGRPCGEIDWAAWYRELRGHGRVETTCGCGADHHLCGFLIHGRWALLLVSPAALHATAAAAIASSLRALAAKLPPAREGVASGAGGQPAREPRPASDGGLLWWVRKPPQ
jgi:hypothetical protein